MTTISAHELAADVAAAKNAVAQGPVTVTDDGKPAFVLMSIADYRELAAPDGTALLEALTMMTDDEIDFPSASIHVPAAKL